MRKIIMYQADDGQIFDTEEECVEYEQSLLYELPDALRLLDENKQPYDARTTEEIEKAYQECTYLEVLDVQDREEKLQRFRDSSGYDVSGLTPGLYVFEYWPKNKWSPANIAD